ncbi:MAG: nitroreductase [Salibacteraceae bacterium]
MKYNLSEINDVIRNRRSIYPEQYSERKVHREMVEVLLKNACWAPTHKMTQPWYFKVFMGEGIQKLATFQAETYKAITPEEKFVERKYRKLQERPLKASAIIAICMKRDPKESVPEVEEVMSVACAVQNMYLTATTYGLGGYWSTGGLTFKDEMKAFLELGEKDRCLGFFYVGYPDIPWPKGQRRHLQYYTDWVES